jgi:hypothetical protein
MRSPSLIRAGSVAATCAVSSGSAALLSALYEVKMMLSNDPFSFKEKLGAGILS